MAMKRVVLAMLLLGGAAGCSTKPSEESCEKAVNNIRKLTGQSHTDIGADKRAAIRSCRAQSSKDTVECMAEARTSDELFACGGKMAEGVKKLLEEQKKEAKDRKDAKEAPPAPAPTPAPEQPAPTPAPEEPAKGP
jgi:hypothetical protein